MSRRSIVFLGTASSIPDQDRFTQSIAICGLRECILLDAGEGVQIRLASVGVDHRDIKIIAISHIHGDHLYGLLPFIESLGLKLASQRSETIFNLKIVAPKNVCKYLFETLNIIKVGELNKIISIECNEAGGVYQHNTFVESPNKEFTLTPIPVEHGLEESYGYFINIKLGRNNIGIYYSGDGVCKDVCIEKLKKLKPLIVIHEATFLDYPKDRTKAIESFHSTVVDAAKVANDVNARILVLTHVSARYRGRDLADFISRARRFFLGEIFIAEDLSKIPLDLVKAGDNR